MKKSSRPQHNTAGRSLFFLFFNAETSVFLLCFVFRLRSALPAQLRFIFSNLGNVLHGEAHSAHLVLAEADNGNLVAQSQDIFHAVDALFCDLGDVNHAFLAGCELNECAELLDEMCIRDSRQSLPT